jgi:predicted negative regulator of RcsB-dependent stress response
MTIKGKSKPRGRKAVTPGPRPAYVPVKRHWWQRGGFWIGVLVVLVAASAAGIWYGFAREMTNNRNAANRKALQTRMRETVTQYQGSVDTIVNPLGQAVQPTGFNVFPTLSTTISDFEKGAVSAKDARSTVTGIAKQAETAYQALDKVDVLGLVQDKGFNEGFVVFMLDSKSKMVTALKVFAHAAQLMESGTELHGAAQDQLVAQAKDLTQIATDTFNDGYTDYIQVQAAARVLNVSPTIPGGPAIPGGP